MEARLQPIVIKESGFRLEDFFDVADFSVNNEEEALSRYLSLPFARSVVQDVGCGLDVVRF